MFELVFYENKRGKSEVLEYLEELYKRKNTDKDSRILYCKIQAYFNMLEKNGTRLSKKITKYLGDSIWELRPLKTRILYAYYKDNKFVILHYFIKKTTKTPKSELEQAKRNLKDYLERNDEQ